MHEYNFCIKLCVYNDKKSSAFCQTSWFKFPVKVLQLGLLNYPKLLTLSVVYHCALFNKLREVANTAVAVNMFIFHIENINKLRL